MGVLYCIAALASFCCLYLLVGYGQRWGADPSGLNLAAFCGGGVLALAASLPLSGPQFPPKLIVIGSLIGVSAGVGLLATVLAVKAGIPLGIVSTAASLALAVPVILSMILYGEVPGPRKWAGLLLAGVAIVLIQREKRS